MKKHIAGNPNCIRTATLPGLFGLKGEESRSRLSLQHAPAWKHAFTPRIFHLPALSIALFFFFFLILAAPLQANEKVTLQLRWDNQFQFAGYYAAKWMGYYKDAGLDVRIRPALTKDSRILSATREVSEGRAEFGIGGADILLAQDKGAKLCIIASIFQESATRFYFRQETSLNNLADLKKMTIARNPGDLIDIEFQALLLAEGVDPLGLDFTPHVPGIDRLVKGRVDLLPGYSLSIPFQASEQNIELNSLNPALYGIKFYGDSLFTRESLAKENPALVQRFKDASLKGWEYALENPEKIADRIAEDLPRIAPVRDRRAYNRFQIAQVQKLALYPLVEVGHTSPDRWANMHDHLLRLGLVKNMLDTETFVFNPVRDQQIRHEERDRILFLFLISLAIASVVFLLWIYALRKTVAARTKSLEEAGASLETEKSLLKAIIDNIPVLLTRYDPEPQMLFFNKAFEKAIGWTTEDANQTDLMEKFYPDPDYRNQAMEYMQKASTDWKEFRVCTKSGGFVDSLWSNMQMDDGTQIGIGIDITQKKQAEKSIRLMEERISLAMEGTRIGFWDWDVPSGRVEYSNIWAEILGYGQGEIEQDYSFWEKKIHPDDKQGVLESLENHLQGRSAVFASEHRLKSKSGEWVWVLGKGSVKDRDGSGAPLRVMGIMMDITHQKNTEQAIQRSKERFDLAMDASRDGLYDWNLVTNEIYYSPGWKRMLGYEDHELPNDFSVWEELTEPEDVKKSWEMQQELISKKRDRFEIEFKMKHKDGRWVEILSRANAYFDESGKAVRIVGTHVDISEIKRALQALRTSEERHKKAQQVAHIGHWELDPNDMVPEWSEEIFRIFGLDPDSGKEPSFTDHDTIVHPEDFPVLDRAVQKAFADGTPFDLVFRIQRPGGKTGWMHAIGTASRDDQGKITRLFGTAQDVTTLQEAQRALSQSRKDLEMAQEIARIGFWKYDVAADKPSWTSEMFRIFGRDPAKGEPNWEEHRQSIHPGDWERLDNAVQNALQKGDSYRERFRTLRKNGGITWAETIGMVHRDEEGNVHTLSGSVQDITELIVHEQEKKRLEEHILQSQKIESIGRLAGGVAHDFNNMLSVILGHTELAMDQLDEDSPFYNDFKEIRLAARRSADLTRQLLAFARKQTISPKILNLNDTVEGMLRMLGRLIGEDINLAWLPGKKLNTIRMDPSQLDQVLANLCVNARDAISGVGKVIIEATNVSFDQAYCDDHAGFAPGEYVLLAVSDDGSGMDKETASNIFEPFFTTKKTGEGTGLGLSTVYGIVKQNDGFINVYSEPGVGTTFRIYLPCHHEQDAGAQQKAADQIPSGKGETLLLVEDEAAIMRMGRRMLERLGYNVLTADTPGEALHIVENHAGDIHLLITDVVMPEMNGRDLAERLQASNPGMKVLYMSGYTADVIAHHGILDEGIQFMQKPFSLAEIASAVRTAFEPEH